MRGPLKAACGLLAAALVVPAIVSTPAQAAGTVRSAVSLTGPTAGNYGGRVALTGKLWRYGTRTVISGHPVVLQRSVHGRNVWGNLTSTRTSSAGTFAFGVSLNGVYDYRAVYAGSATYTSAVSGKVFPAVRRVVFFDSIKTSNNAQAETNNGTLTVTGRVYPAVPAGVRVWLQRWDGRTWRNYMSTVTRGSTSSLTVRGDVPGTAAAFRLLVPASAPYYGATSRSVRFAHYVWRGTFDRPVLAQGGSGTPRNNSDLQGDRTGNFAYTWADKGGASWIDISTSGCIELWLGAHNTSMDLGPTATRERLTVIKAGSPLRTADLEPDEHLSYRYTLGGTARLRFQVQDVGHTGRPSAYWNAGALCSN